MLIGNIIEAVMKLLNQMNNHIVLTRGLFTICCSSFICSESGMFDLPTDSRRPQTASNLSLPPSNKVSPRAANQSNPSDRLRRQTGHN